MTNSTDIGMIGDSGARTEVGNQRPDRLTVLARAAVEDDNDGRPPLPADAEAALAVARAENASMIRENAKAGSSYAGEWKKFVSFVNDHPLLDTDSQDRYLCRQNIDLYFSVVVVQRRGTHVFLCLLPMLLSISCLPQPLQNCIHFSCIRLCHFRVA